MSSKLTLKGGSLALSVGAHLLVVAVLLIGLWEWQTPAPPLQRLAIEATLVDPSSVQGLTGPQLPEPQPVAPEVCWRKSFYLKVESSLARHHQMPRKPMFEHWECNTLLDMTGKISWKR
jgi:hypothetical protein